MDTTRDTANALIDDANKDEELREWFKTFNAYVRKILPQAGYVLEPDCNNRGNQIRDSARQFYVGEYKNHFDNLFSSVRDWFKAMCEEPTNQRFREDWARLTKDSCEGSLKFKLDLWSDIRTVTVPILVNKVGYIPIPRI